MSSVFEMLERKHLIRKIMLISFRFKPNCTQSVSSYLIEPSNSSGYLRIFYKNTEKIVFQSKIEFGCKQNIFEFENEFKFNKEMI